MRVDQCEAYEWLSDVDDASVDLIATDPPYNTGHHWGEYDDRWDSTEAYIASMRMVMTEARRTLKATGSLYVQCDWRMSAYLRVMLDDVFCPDNFRNEVIWHYSKWSNDSRQFQKNHDTLLFYSNGNRWTFNPEYTMTADKSRKLMRGYAVNRPNAVKQLIVYDREAARRKIEEGDYDQIVFKDSDDPGVMLHDVWDDINILNSQDQERQGYPTQKPLALYERIIRASSNPGDMVVDPFAGSGTTLVAAKRLERRYAGCDINPDAVAIANARLEELLL